MFINDKTLSLYNIKPKFTIFYMELLKNMSYFVIDSGVLLLAIHVHIALK